MVYLVPNTNMSKLRIAILAHFPLEALDTGATGRGGGQVCTWLPQLALSFNGNNDLEVHWVILDKTTRKTIIIKALGQYFHRVPAVPFSVDLALNYLPARIILRREIQRIKPDVVHAWGTEHIYSAALRDCRQPTILSMQGILTEYQRIGGLSNDWRWRKMVATEAEIIRSATVVTSESQWGINRVLEIYPQAKCRMVEYGVHPGFYQIPWNPDKDHPFVLYVGGNSRRKGLNVLLEAMKLLPHRDWQLRLAGCDSLQNECEAAGIKDCLCLGLLPWDEMQRQLQGAWCSVLPTRGDTSPNSVKEARVVGLPVITTPYGGQAGYIHDGENGFIVDPLTPESLSKAMDTLMSDYSLTKKMGATHHKKDRDYFRPEQTAVGFERIYRELTGRQ
jgi:glycosyltransferase involved in cell wall biosynthesis